MKLLLILSFGSLGAGFVLPLFFQRKPAASYFGAGATLLSAVLGLVPALWVLLGGAPLSIHFSPVFTLFPVSLQLDALSALFLFAIYLVSALSAVYGVGYLKKYGEEKNIGASWFFFNTLVASMALVCLARNAMPAGL